MTRDDMIQAAVLGFRSTLFETSVPAGRFFDTYLERHGGTLPPSDIARIRDLYRMIERVALPEQGGAGASDRRREHDMDRASFPNSFVNLRLIG